MSVCSVPYPYPLDRASGNRHLPRMNSVIRLPRQPKAVVFDLDGTLIDSEALVLEAYMAAADQHGVPFTHEQFLSLVGRHRQHSEMKMREYFGQAFPLEQFYATVGEFVGDKHAPLKPGASALFDRLDRTTTPFALATSSGPGWVDKHFRAHDLARRFRGVITREDVTNGKPHPEPYLKASTMLGHSPGDVLAIEDSPTGVASAHAAGLMTIMIPDLIQPDDETRGRVIHVGKTLEDVLGLLED
jgi:beta-phosphoglucomutase-like phosphatase (HAD superfamily)